MAFEVTGYAGDSGLYQSKTLDELLVKPTLVREQLVDDGTGGVRSAGMIALSTNAVADGDTLRITDGTTTEVFTFKNVVSTTFQIEIAGTVALTTANIVAAINKDSTLWFAKAVTTLGDYFSPIITPAIVIWRRAATDGDDRFFGTIAAGQSTIKVVQFTRVDYSTTSITVIDLSITDLTIRMFGFSRLVTSLLHCESYTSVEDCISWYWHKSSQTWLTGGGETSSGWGISILHENQLVDGGSGGIAPAMLFRFITVAGVGNTVVIGRTGSNETYTGVAAGPVGLQFIVGATPAESAVNLVAAIALNSSLFKGATTTACDPYFEAIGGTKVIISRLIATSESDRMFGTTSVEIATFGQHAIGYSPDDVKNMIMTVLDPGTEGQVCGKAIPLTDIDPCNTFKVATDCGIYSWRQDTGTWQRVVDVSLEGQPDGYGGLDVEALLKAELRSSGNPVLCDEQFEDGGSSGICAAAAINLSGLPALFGDTFVIKNDTVTETYTGMEGDPIVAFDFNVGPNAIRAMRGLAAAINTDSVLYSAVVYTTLGYFFAAAPTTVLVIYNKLAGTGTFRFFGTISATAKVCGFNDTYDYTVKSSTEVALPAADPTTPVCGYGRVTAALISGQTYTAQATNSKLTWRDDTNLWEPVGDPTLSRWRRYNLSTVDFDTAATANHIELFLLPARGIIEAVVIEHSEAFTGGSISAYTLSVGILANLVKYGAAFDVFQAVGPFGSDVYAFLGLESIGSATSIRVAATSTGGNLNTATLGAATIWVKTSQMPQP